MMQRHDVGVPSRPEAAPGLSRRGFLGALGLGALGGAAALKTVEAIGGLLEQMMPVSPATLEEQKAEFVRMSSPELAQWILNSTGDEATSDHPVRTPKTTPAYEDLNNIAKGKPAYGQTVLTLDGKKIKMDVEINRDILLFRALLTTALRDPANYFEGKPILVQSGQLTNRSGSHKSRVGKSHFYGSSIDFSGALVDGSKSDVYAYDSPINRQLGMIADAVGKVVGVKTSGSAKSLERVDSVQGTPGLSKGHYHYNASDTSAGDHANVVRSTILDQPEQFFRLEQPVIDLNLAGISTDGRGFIHTYETFRDTTYGDAGGSRGTLTIGYGATYYLEGTVITRDGKEMVVESDNQKPRMGDKITKYDADLLSKKMIEREYLKPVVAALEKNGMTATQQQLDALVSYSYHRGGGNAGKLVGRLKKLADAGHGNDALAIRAAFMFDINGEVAARFRNGVADRYLDTADIFIRGSYKRENRQFDPIGWGVVIAAYFKR